MKTLNAPKTGFTFLMQNIFFPLILKESMFMLLTDFVKFTPLTFEQWQWI